MSRILIVAMLCMLCSEFAAARPTSYLPADHPVYDLLERLEQRFPGDEIHLGIRPMTRLQAAKYLFGAVVHRDKMTSVERDELDIFLDEFAPDFSSGGGWYWDPEGPYKRLPGFLDGYVYGNGRNLFSARGYGYSLYFDPVIVREYSFGTSPITSDDDNVHTATNGFTLYGTIGNHLGYHIDVRDSREWGSREYPKSTATTLPGIGFASFKEDHAEFDETRAHLLFTGGPFNIMLGRDTNIWGRGERSLMFSGYGAPYDMLRIDTSFWRLRFLSFAAEIEQFPPIAQFYYPVPAGDFADSVAVKKYLSGHRIEINITDRLSLGLHESVVYGGRWDVSYLNPVMFYKGAEHANGDHDNSLIGMDINWIMGNDMSIYGELLIDDITTTKLGTDWYGNKLAIRGGLYAVDPAWFDDMDIRLEYTRLNPWVYTHRYAIDSFTHYGDVLGTPLGPNSDEMLVAFRKRFSRRLNAGLTYTHYRHGDNTASRNVGGDPLDGFSQGDSTSASFLDGNLTTATAVSASVSYEIIWRLFLKAGIARMRRNGETVSRYSFSMSFNQ